MGPCAVGAGLGGWCPEEMETVLPRDHILLSAHQNTLTRSLSALVGTWGAAVLGLVRGGTLPPAEGGCLGLVRGGTLPPAEGGWPGLGKRVPVAGSPWKSTASSPPQLLRQPPQGAPRSLCPLLGHGAVLPEMPVRGPSGPCAVTSHSPGPEPAPGGLKEPRGGVLHALGAARRGAPPLSCPVPSPLPWCSCPQRVTSVRLSPPPSTSCSCR